MAKVILNSVCKEPHSGPSKFRKRIAKITSLHFSQFSSLSFSFEKYLGLILLADLGIEM